jgi:hypothetical protein
MSDIVMCAVITFLLVKSFYQNRLSYYRREVAELREESEQLAVLVQSLQVKLGSHDIDWDLNDFLDDEDEWTQFDDRRNEA